MSCDGPLPAGRVQRVEKLGDLDPPSDETRDRGAQLSHRLRRRSAGREVQARTLQQHVFFEPPELRRGRDSEVFVEAARELGVGAESLGLSSAPVEPEHQARSEAFAQWEFVEGRPDEVDRQRVLAERQARIGELLDGDGSQIVEAGDLGAGRDDVADVGERGPAPEVERLGQLRDGTCGIAADDRLAGEEHQPLEALGVELVGLHPEHVAVGSVRKAGTGRARAAVELEHLADPADVHAQRGRGARRRIALPELIDELLGRDRPVGPDREQREQLARLLAAYMQRRAVVPHLDRSEDSQLHPVPQLCPRGNRTSAPGQPPGSVYGLFTGVPYTFTMDVPQ